VDKSLKLVVAIVKPVEFDETLNALTRLGIQGATCSEVRDYGQKGPTVFCRGAQHTAKFLTVLKIEVVVPSEHVGKVTNAIVATARSARVLVLDMAHGTLARTEWIDEIAPPRAA
jgi:nitrogen regulatory protein P-II 1